MKELSPFFCPNGMTSGMFSKTADFQSNLIFIPIAIKNFSILRGEYHDDLCQ
jgi:hypothetical protein